MPLFVISFEYLAKLVMNFWPTRHFCRNFLCSTKVCHFLIITAICQDFPLCHLIEVLPKIWWILSQFPVFSNLPFSRKSPTVNMLLLLFHLNFLPDLQWFLCQTRKICHFRKTYNYRHASFVILRKFCQICHFYKIAICQDAPFCHLICIWPNPWILHFCRDLPFPPKFAMFLS